MEYVTPFALIGSGALILLLVHLLIPVYLFRIYCHTASMERQLRDELKSMHEEVKIMRTAIDDFHHDVATFLERIDISR